MNNNKCWASGNPGREGIMFLNNIGLVLEVIGVAVIWRAAYFIPRWVYEADKEGHERLNKNKKMSPGIQWKRLHNCGLGFLFSGFLSQLAGNLFCG